MTDDVEWFAVNEDGMRLLTEEERQQAQKIVGDASHDMGIIMTDDPLTPALSDAECAIYHSMLTVFDAFCITHDARWIPPCKKELGW